MESVYDLEFISFSPVIGELYIEVFRARAKNLYNGHGRTWFPWIVKRVISPFD